MSRQLLDLHEGQVPRPREALVALPGVGRKTANVVLNTGFGEPTIAVDTPHLPRVEPHGPGARQGRARGRDAVAQDGARRVPPRSEEHTSELQSLMRISYAVFCLKKKIKKPQQQQQY